jgi:magnesium-transporting ATPase (P-type)
MGISGTEVAKESSDIIILDDDFTSVVKVCLLDRIIEVRTSFLEYAREPVERT